MSPVSVESGGRLAHLEDPIELKTLAHHNSAPAVDDRHQRRWIKSKNKLGELHEQQAMKFSHSVQFNAVPDWSSYYIWYSNLKKL